MGEGSLAILVKLLLTRPGSLAARTRIASGTPTRRWWCVRPRTWRSAGSCSVTRHQDDEPLRAYELPGTVTTPRNKVDLVPPLEVTETAPPVTTPVSPSPPRPSPSSRTPKSTPFELVPLERPAPPQPLADGHLVQGDQVATREELRDSLVTTCWRSRGDRTTSSATASRPT